MIRDGHAVLPHVWLNQRVSPQQGPGLSVGQVGGGFAIDGQDEVADTQSPVAADGATLDDAADEHAQTVLPGAHRHPCQVNQSNRGFCYASKHSHEKKKISQEMLLFNLQIL